MKENSSMPTSRELSMNRSRSLLHAACLSALIGLGMPVLNAADANPPKALTYQGYLTDGSGNPLGPVNPANYDVVFKIYNASTGGVLKWAEKQTVTIDKGQFSVVLGEGAVNGSDPRPDLATVFSAADASDRFIGITVKISGTDVDIAPRLRLVTSPYSFLAKSASALVGADGATVLAATSPGVMTVTGQLNATGFTGSGAGLNSLSASQITTGTLADARLSGNIPVMSGGKISDSVIPGTLSGKIFNTGVGITAANTLEFGQGVAGKEGSAGKIGYGTFTTGTLDIVGAGSSGTARKIKFWGEGGSTFSGAVAINSTTGSPALDVNSSGIWRSVTIRGTGGTDVLVAGNLNGRPSIGGHNQAGNAWADISINPGGGKVGIGTSNPSYLLTMGTGDDSQSRIRFDAPSGYLEMGRYVNYFFVQLNNNVHTTANRMASYDGDSNWDFSSDRKLKKDIVDVEPMLERALKVQVRRYRWKEDKSDATHKLGVIAQEVQPLFPEMVSEVASPSGDHEKTLSVGYGDFGVIAIKSIQELNKIVEAKESRIASLEEKAAKVEALERELEVVKRKLASAEDSAARTEARVQELDSLVRKLASTLPAAGAVVAERAAR